MASWRGIALLAGASIVSLDCWAEPPRPVPSRSATGPATNLESAFRDPPARARPYVWWHWMDGNVSREGIVRDLAWMKRVGIGGAQMFDAGIKTQQVVDQRASFLSDAWKADVRLAAAEADRLGLELGFASATGWSETGGPTVPPEDGMKKIVWSETEVAGGEPAGRKVAEPPRIVGPFQNMPEHDEIAALSGGYPLPALPQPLYRDVAVLAYPLTGPAEPAPARIVDQDGRSIDAGPLSDGDYETGIQIRRPGASVARFTYRFGNRQTVRAIRLCVQGASSLLGGAIVAPILEASDDGIGWRKVADLAVGSLPTTTAFEPVEAAYFRVSFPSAKPAAVALPSPASGVDLSAMMALSAAMAPAPLKVTELTLWSEDRVDHGEVKAGFGVAPRYAEVSPPLSDAVGIPTTNVVDLTGRLRADGTLDWAPPPGRWRVIRLGYSLIGKMNHPAETAATGLEVDKLDGAAVRRYLDQRIGQFRGAVGSNLLGRRGLRALVTDSTEVGAFNWTPRMIEHFARLRGYDPTPWLPVLTGAVVGSRAQSDRFLFDFRRTIADLVVSEHYGTIAAVAHENGLKVYGEALENSRPSLGDDMAMRHFTDVPMGAMWTYERAKGPSPSFVADLRGAASVAHAYGQNIVGAESMTSFLAPWAFGPRDLKRVVDLEFALGVNRPIIHSSVHVPIEGKKPGLTLSIFGQYFNRNESWAELARPWTDYIARNSLLLQAGRNVADVAYFYGDEAPLTGLFVDRPIGDAPKHNAYDFINADVLAHATVSGDGAVVTAGQATYRAIYLGIGSEQMTLASLRRLASLVERGATLIGRRPSSPPGLADTSAEFNAIADKLWAKGAPGRVGAGRVFDTGDVETGLAAAGISPDFRYSGGSAGSSILFVHRALPDGQSYYLTNRLDSSEHVEARFRVTGKRPELWHAEDGSVEPVGYRIEGGETVVPLTLAGDESVHVVFRKAATAQSADLPARPRKVFGELTGPWTVALQPGRGAPATIAMERLAPLDRNPDPGVRYFSGVARYTKSFEAPTGWRKGAPLWVDLGDAREIAHVYVNGIAAGYAWHAPYAVDVSRLVRRGRNILTVEVANLWVNRLVGDAQPGGQKISWTSGPTYLAKAALRPSGLLGPVELTSGR